MNKRLLGRTGIKVSEISFGGVEIGLPYGIGVDSQEGMLAESEAIKLLHAALDNGVNFFDTARMYGKSEDIMGKAFKDRRDEVVICTKCKHLPIDKKKAPVPNELKEIINNSFKESLSALQTNYIDLYMIHNANLEILENQEIADAFIQLKKDGAIRAAGVSTYSLAETKQAIESGIWDVIQLSFNLMDQRQADLFPYAQQNNIGIMVRSVLLKGVLSDRGRNLHPVLKSVEEHRNKYNELFNKDMPTLSALATKFALSFQEVSSVLVGIDRMEYLQNALTVADGKYFDQNTFDRARELGYPEPDFLDLRTWDQMGWLK